MKVSLVGLAVFSAVLLWYFVLGGDPGQGLSVGLGASADSFRAHQLEEEARRRSDFLHATIPEQHALISLCVARLQERMQSQSSPAWSVIGVVAPATSLQENLFSPNFRRIRLEGDDVEHFVRDVALRAFAASDEAIPPQGIQFLVNEVRLVPGFTESPRFIVGYHCQFLELDEVFLSRGVTISGN